MIGEWVQYCALGGKQVPVPLSPQKIWHGLTWHWFRTSTARDWRLTDRRVVSPTCRLRPNVPHWNNVVTRPTVPITTILSDNTPTNFLLTSRRRVVTAIKVKQWRNIDRTQHFWLFLDVIVNALHRNTECFPCLSKGLTFNHLRYIASEKIYNRYLLNWQSIMLHDQLFL